MDVTYVLPIRCGPDHGHPDLPAYLRELCRLAEVLVVDGSDPEVFAAHAASLAGSRVRHVPPDPTIGFDNGKANGVTTGIRIASHERIILADDDVRYLPAQLLAVAAMLDEADVVVPQNVFDPLPWHARWDTARTLINRAVGTDFPGTLGVRRSRFLAVGGYDGDVLFENLELMRTVQAGGGRVTHAPGIYVRRLPPSTKLFLSQRARQAYDDLAQPVKLAGFLLTGPLVLRAIARRRWKRLTVAAGISIALAESGRRRAGGASVFPASSSLLAPAWVLERAICAWLAVGARVLLGGCPYRGLRIRRAANPMRRLRRRVR